MKENEKEKKRFRFIIKNKNAVIICSLIVLVAAVGYVNYLLTNGATSKGGDAKSQAVSAEEGESVDVFAAYRDERTTARAQEISYIDSVVTSAETDQATKTQAQEQKLALIKNMENELTIEGLITTKLSTDAVVTVKEGAVNVVVKRESLSDEEVAQIAEIVKAQTEESAQNIKIMPQG